MLRYVDFNPTTQTVEEFCCSRAVFSGVTIKVPDIKSLFDNTYIESTFKRYKRNGNEDMYILRQSCGKCGGFGYYDWVTRLTSDDNVENLVNLGHDLKVAQKVKNENPITTIYHHIIYQHKERYIYPSYFEPDPLTYQCEHCLGTGLAIKTEFLEPVSIDNLPQPKI